MPETKKFCPKCGTEHPDGKKFCKKCGEHLSSYIPPGANLSGRNSGVLNKVTSTVSKVESTVNTAARIGSAAEQITQVIVRPPAEWTVIVGEMAPQLGKEAGNRVVATAASQAQGKILEQVQKTTSTDTESIIPPMAPPGEVCQSCGFTSPPGAKFCESCGMTLGGRPVQRSVPSSLTCPSCGKSLNPGAKFCGSCGTTISYAGTGTPVQAPPQNQCPSCGNPLKPGKTFCGKCGAKIS